VKVAAARKTLEAEIRRLALDGATVEDDSGDYEVRLQVIAPAGKRWVDGPRCLVCSTFRGHQSWLDDAVKDTRERVAFGMRDASPEELDEGDGE
jgi:Zn ribbon nucleic-acid-binding protein